MGRWKYRFAGKEKRLALGSYSSASLKPRTKGHYARIDVKELPHLLRRMQAYEGAVFTRYALQLLALTFVRTTELIAARWDEFDLDAAECRIPAARMKMDSPHIVPLARQAVYALRCLHEHRGLHGLLFPNERDHEKLMSNCGRLPTAFCEITLLSVT